MKERVVVLFLFAMGSIKVYENFAEDDDSDEDAKDEAFRKSKIGRRSVWGMEESSDKENSLSDDEYGVNWSLYFEEVVEAGSPHRHGPHCSQITDDECSCRRLVCFGERSCFRNLTIPLSAPIQNDIGSDNNPIPLRPPKVSLKEKLLQCRHTIMFGENLCECKRYSREINLNDVEIAPPPPAAAQAPAQASSAVVDQPHQSEMSEKVRRFHERRSLKLNGS